jgi:hypothetical protein
VKFTTKTLRRAIGAAALATILATAASAQSPSCRRPPRHRPRVPSRARLGQMLAPIALYPDKLLADILRAATF